METARVTWLEVTAVLEDTDLSETVGTAMIGSAHALVETAYPSEDGMTEDELKQVELWLSAHFASMRDRRAHMEKVGDESVTFEGKTGMGLEATLYGQQALLFDKTGRLKDRTSKRKPFRFKADSPRAYFTPEDYSRAYGR